MKKIILSICFLIISAVSYAEDYSFEIPKPEEKKEVLELSGNLDVKYSILKSRKDSPFYNLQYYKMQLSDNLSSYRMNFYLNGDYQTKDIDFHLKTYSEYYNDNETDFKIFELFGNINLSDKSFLLLGKKMYSWGKGYAFNPAGYVNPVKDPENPELSQSGIFSINYQYSKSFKTGPVKNTSFDLIVIPSAETINNKISETKNTDIAGKLYFLFLDTDLDIMGYYSSINSKNISFDFSRNVLPNLEMHGEFNRFTNQPKHIISNNILETETIAGASYLAGIRWLNKWNITTILEYYKNEAGLNKEEFSGINNFIENAVTSGNKDSTSGAMNTNKKYFNGANLMQDYLYLKLSLPEPFNLVDFTPSVYTIYNITDKSHMIGIPLSYKPVTNFELILLPTFLSGNKNTEYGSKQYENKIELWTRFYF
ncbi:hypothetical protein HY745_02445 [Candidatus Desantisbacteria bacterium]|nr:hypothetical protein [Candidatus Desantisbacteria bacterium]